MWFWGPEGNFWERSTEEEPLFLWHLSEVSCQVRIRNPKFAAEADDMEVTLLSCQLGTSRDEGPSSEKLPRSDWPRAYLWRHGLG